MDRTAGTFVRPVLVLGCCLILAGCQLNLDLPEPPESPEPDLDGRSAEGGFAAAADAGRAALEDESGEALARAIEEHEPTEDERALVALFYLMVADAQQTGQFNQKLLDMGIFEEVQGLADRYPSVFVAAMADSDEVAGASAALIRSKDDFSCDKTCALDPVVFASALLSLAPIEAADVLKTDKAKEIWAQLSLVLDAATVREIALDEAAGMIDADTVNSILGLAASLVAGPEVLAAAAAGATVSTVAVVAAVIGAASAAFAAGRTIGQGIQLGIDCQLFKDDNCGGLCGNGIIESGISTPEWCDPATDCDDDLPAELCESSCPADDSECDDGDACTVNYVEGDGFDCTAHCVDEPIERCLDDDGCCPDGCYARDDNDCSPACGNGVIDTDLGEICDGDELGGESCESGGYSRGTLRCAADCESFDESACTYCGNAILDDGELCDLNQLRGESCESLGFGSGELRCDITDCSSWDVSLCEQEEFCGDGEMNGQEECDGSDFGYTTNAPCSDYWFDTGMLSCTQDCERDFSACRGGLFCNPNTQVPVCEGGDGCCLSGCSWSNDSDCDWQEPCPTCELNRTACDHGQVVSQTWFSGNNTWTSRHYDSCDNKGCEVTEDGPQCLECEDGFCPCDLDPDNCCDNVRIDSGEVCEATIVDSTCELEGYDGGSLGCSSDCKSFNETACCLDACSAGQCIDGQLKLCEAAQGNRCRTLAAVAQVCEGGCNANGTQCVFEDDCPASWSDGATQEEMDQWATDVGGSCIERSYYEGGALKSETTYVAHDNGDGSWTASPDGPLNYYYESGVLEWERSLAARQKSDGTWTGISTYILEGFERHYYESGALRSETPHEVYQESDGTWRSTSMGLCQVYYESGALLRRYTVASAVGAGPYEVWFEGAPEGLAHEYYESGPVRSEWWYDQETFCWLKQYDLSGNITGSVDDSWAWIDSGICL